jgi:hypothetical protein
MSAMRSPRSAATAWVRLVDEFREDRGGAGLDLSLACAARVRAS